MEPGGKRDGDVHERGLVLKAFDADSDWSALGDAGRDKSADTSWRGVHNSSTTIVNPNRGQALTVHREALPSNRDAPALDGVRRMNGENGGRVGHGSAVPGR
jgi:hypothetical protein